jgi:hypothetical protein
VQYTLINGHPVPIRHLADWGFTRGNGFVLRHGLTSAAGRELAVTLNCDLTPELFLEGLASDIKRRIAEFRKTAGLALTDKPGILVGVSEEAEWWAVQCYRNEIARDTNCSRVRAMLCAEHKTNISLLTPR